jgi:hypothetical protein
MLRIVLYLSVLLFVYLAAGIVYGIVLLITGGRPIGATDFLGNLPFVTSAYVLLAVVTLFVTLGFTAYVDRLPIARLGLSKQGSWSGELVFGMGLGFVATGLILAISIALGWTRFHGLNFEAKTGTDLALAFALMTAIALLEETMMRGYVLRNLKWGYGPVPALIASSVFFGLIHVVNPGGALPGILGTTAAGLVLGYSYLATGRLWLPMGFHFAWNFFLGPVFGFPVSGIELDSLISQTTVGSPIWTGGQFGPEAGLLATGVLVLCALAIRSFGKVVRE